MKETKTKAVVKKLQQTSQGRIHQKEQGLKKTTDKEVASLKKMVVRLEKKILLMQGEINKKQDKKITFTISRYRIMQRLKDLQSLPSNYYKF